MMKKLDDSKCLTAQEAPRSSLVALQYHIKPIDENFT